jgi:hypothetical protein
MATKKASVGTDNSVVLSSAQTGNGPSTDVCDRGFVAPGPALLTVVTTVGATPTVLVDIQGSADGTDWFNVAYATAAAPETVTVAQVGPITTAITSRFILRPNHPWRYLRLNYSSNTNVTLTATLFVFPANTNPY